MSIVNDLAPYRDEDGEIRLKVESFDDCKNWIVSLMRCQLNVLQCVESHKKKIDELILSIRDLENEV
jgi:hypothetical protein